MSGSGSTVFALMRSDADADILAKRAKSELDPELWTWVCETSGGSAAPSGDAI
jgi:4-diphosphocytidyl-2C-methyl-D-erythritol kinase